MELLDVAAQVPDELVVASAEKADILGVAEVLHRVELS